MKALTRLGRKQFTDWAGGGWTPLGGYGAPGSPAKVTQAINTYGGTDESSATVFACVTKIANELAGYPWQLVDPADKVLAKTAENEDLFALMEEPSEDVTYFDWASDVETDLCLVGNSYWLEDNMNGLGQPDALERLFPHDVSIVVSPSGKKIGYVVQVRGRQIPFGLDEILHFRTRNPFNKYLGMGVVEAIMREVNTDIAEAEHVSSYFMNGARIGGVLTLPADVDQPTFDRLKKEVNESYGGPMNAYKTLVAAGATDFKPVSEPPRRTGVVELRRMTQDAIYKGFGIPEFLLGGVAQGGVYKMSEAQFIFYRNMLPRARRYQERLTISLTSKWSGVKFEVLPEMNEPPEDKLINAERLPRVGASLNETRLAAGLPKIDDTGADVPLVQQGFVPFGTVAIGEQIRQITDGPVTVPRLGPGEKAPSALPSPLSTHVFRDDKDAANQPIADAVVVVSSPLLPPGFEQRSDLEPKHATSEAVQQLVDGQAEFLHTAYPAMADAFRAYFGEQQKRTLQALSDVGAKNVGGDRKSRYAALKGLTVEDVFDMSRENEALQTFYLALLDSLGELALQTPKKLLGALGTGISWSEQSKHIWAARSHIADKVKQINETTRDRLKSMIEDGVDRGYSIPQIATGNQQENYGGVVGSFDESSGARAETIARTESAFLYNAAATAANDEAGVKQVEVFDGQYDEACKKANGAVWSNDKAKKNPIQHPNCVRAFAPLVDIPKHVQVEEDDGHKAVPFRGDEHPRWPAGTPGVGGQFRDDWASHLAQEAEPIIPTVEHLRSAPPSNTAAKAVQNGYAARHIIESDPEVKEAFVHWKVALDKRDGAIERKVQLEKSEDWESWNKEVFAAARAGKPAPPDPKNLAEVLATANDIEAHTKDLSVAAKRLGRVRAKKTVELLRDVRGDTGFPHLESKAEIRPEARLVQDKMAELTRLLPDEWRRLSNDNGQLLVGRNFDTSGRVTGSYHTKTGPSRLDHSPDGHIAIEPEAEDQSYLHEFTHRMEHLNPALRKIEADFFDYRTEGEDWKKMPGAGGGEMTYKRDKWERAYAGRVYPEDGRFLEALTTGVEMVYGSVQNVGKDSWQEDSEHIAFTLGMLVRDQRQVSAENAMEAEINVRLDSVMADLPSPDAKMKQKAVSFDQLAEQGKQAQDDYEALLNLGHGVGDAFNGQTHHLGNRSEFDPKAVTAAQDAVAAAPDQFHVLLVPHKGEKRLKEKVENKYGGDVSGITDFVRGSILVPDPADSERVLAELKAQAQAKGFKVGPTENKLVKGTDPHASGPQGGYRDVSLVMEAPNGHVTELQILPTQMWLHKEKAGSDPAYPGESGHSMYETVRPLAERKKKGEELSPSEEQIIEETSIKMDALYKHAWAETIKTANEVRRKS